MTIAKAQYGIPGGVHPAYHKELAREAAIETLPPPATLTVSMAQHLGQPARPLVKKGDTVARGQRIGEAAGFISAHVHAPVSGTVAGVADAPTLSGAAAPAVTLERAQSDPAPDAFLDPIPDWHAADPKVLLERVAEAGIVGMGGAGFPTHVKLSPPSEKTIHTLIVNGAECEPYLTADFRLMVERAEQIWAGVRILRRILGVDTVRIAIEDNKPEAVEALRAVMDGADGDTAIVLLKTAYPQGAEKQQIYAALGLEVPSGGLPMDVGALVENVGTAYAVWDAVVNGRPLIERVTTVTGGPVAQPKNVLGPIGASFGDLVAFAGGFRAPVAKLIAGGPMMGLAQSALGVAVTKTTSGILALAPDAVTFFSSMPCIACGRCVDACPAGLIPSELSQFLEAEDYAAAAERNVMDCIECGCCAFVCPAHRPMVQHMRRGKAWVAEQKRKQR
jgi:Na+-translocating ferredoxin:NAD+ oxidoreductase subunit C